MLSAQPAVPRSIRASAECLGPGPTRSTPRGPEPPGWHCAIRLSHAGTALAPGRIGRHRGPAAAPRCRRGGNGFRPTCARTRSRACWSESISAAPAPRGCSRAAMSPDTSWSKRRSCMTEADCAMPPRGLRPPGCGTRRSGPQAFCRSSNGPRNGRLRGKHRAASGPTPTVCEADLPVG
jgi:hypothetical protein